LYASDPLDKVGKGGTAVTVLCVDGMQDNQYVKFTYDEITSLNKGVTLKSLSLGVSYISIGSSVQLQIFSGPNFDGETTSMKSQGTGVNIDLTKVPYPQKGKFSGWNDKPMSFIVSSA
jgi:hypothetical protein